MDGNMWLILAIIAFVIVIIVVLWRFLSMLRKDVPGGSKLGTVDLIKSWQDGKQAEADYRTQIRQEARKEAMSIAEGELREQYVREEVDRLKGVSKPSGFGSELGKLVNTDKVNDMLGIKKENTNPSGLSNSMFSDDKLKRMVGRQVDESKIQQAGESQIDFNRGVRNAVNNNSKVDINKILHKRSSPIDERNQRRYR